MYKYPTFRPALRSIAAAIFAMSCMRCEAVLGADFDGFDRAYDGEGSIDDSGASRDQAEGQDLTMLDGSTGVSIGGAGGVSTTVGGAGGKAGTRGAGGRGGSAGAGGTAGSSGTSDAGGGRDGLLTDASVLDASSDGSDVAEVGSRDSADEGTTDDASTDPAAPPSRDGGTSGGACTPNEVRSIAACGNCGLFLQVCNAEGVWDAPFCRQEPSACAPGSTERRACPSGGTQLATCNASCTWSVGECIRPPCSAGQTEVLPCSLCGTQTRTCQATEGGAEWGPFSACANQGICAAGTTDVTTCGKCGTYSRVCNATCTWEPWGACAGEGECVPGTTESRNCTILIILVLGKQTRTCDASCTWGAYSDCR
jgi:hypothetical protein